MEAYLVSEWRGMWGGAPPFNRTKARKGLESPVLIPKDEALFSLLAGEMGDVVLAALEDQGRTSTGLAISEPLLLPLGLEDTLHPVVSRVAGRVIRGEGPDVVHAGDRPVPLPLQDIELPEDLLHHVDLNHGRVPVHLHHSPRQVPPDIFSFLTLSGSCEE